IEFAAPRIEVLGVEGLAAGLDHSLPLLTTRRRTAMPRHRTMRAVVDWSYGLLSEDEQRFVRALGIFAGGFTVEAADAVAIDAADTSFEAIDRLADLVAKSLVVADVSGGPAQFRLLETTRLYAVERLRAEGEHWEAARRHAEYYRDIFAPAEAESESRTQAEWLAVYGRHIDNVRAGLDWAFSPEGDSRIGMALTIAALPLWVQLSLFGECRERVAQALAVVDSDAASTARPRMQLYAALGWSLMYGVGRA